MMINRGVAAVNIKLITTIPVKGAISMDNAEKRKLALVACNVRKGIIEGVFNAKSGHPGGSLSIADVLTYLYEKE